MPHEEEAVAGWLAGEEPVCEVVGDWHEGEGEGDAETCRQVQLEGWGGHLVGLFGEDLDAEVEAELGVFKLA